MRATASRMPLSWDYPEKECRTCGKEFSPKQPAQLYCSKLCRPVRQTYQGNKSNACTTGAASELIASVDLLRKGWTVFRSLTPNSFADIIACKGAVILRLEVRTAHSHVSNGNWYFHKLRAPMTDGFAVVIGHEVRYIPPLPEEGAPCSSTK